MRRCQSRKRNILRSRAKMRPAFRVRTSKRCIMTAKVQLHYRRLLQKTRLQGLWSWRRVPLRLRSCGLPVHTGTVPVARLWNTAMNMFPPQSRTMSTPWFTLLANMAYLRINFQHFNGPSLPGWCRHDALLKESLDHLMSAALTFAQDAFCVECLLGVSLCVYVCLCVCVCICVCVGVWRVLEIMAKQQQQTHEFISQVFKPLIQILYRFKSEPKKAVFPDA